MNEDTEALDGTVEAPLYAWRIYRVVQRGEGKGLTPLYASRISKDGTPRWNDSVARRYGLTANEEGWAYVDLLGWVEADKAPLMYRPGTINGGEKNVDTHGIHAFHGKGQAIKYTDGFFATWATSDEQYREAILAKIELQGVVVEHEYGYRAEKIRIVELHSGGNEEQRAGLANDLGWPFDIEECDLMPAGEKRLKKEPKIVISCDVAALTAELARMGDVAAMLSQRVGEYTRNNQPVPKDDKLMREVCAEIRRQDDQAYHLVMKLHDYLTEFWVRGIETDWGMYGNDPYFIMPQDREKRRQYTSNTISAGYYHTDPLSLKQDLELFEDFLLFLRKAGTAWVFKEIKGDDRDTYAVANPFIPLMPMIAGPADLAHDSDYWVKNKVKFMAETRLAMQIYQPTFKPFITF